MMWSFFNQLAEGITKKLDAIEGDPEATRARKRLALEIARIGRRLYSGEETIAWSGVVAPFDLLNAMGLTSCFVEFVGAQIAAMGTAGPALDGAEQAGFAAESCGYHRAIAGAMLAGLMPKPDVLIATSTPCSGGLAVLEAMARHFEKPLFVLHIPQCDDERAVRYLARQLEEMTAFVEAHTPHKLDREKVREAIRLTNEAREVLVEMFEISRSTPSPARRRDLVNFGIVISLLLGRQEAVDVATCYRDELHRRVERGQGGSEQEKLRLLWIQNRIQFKTDIERMLEEEHGAVVVLDELNDITWQPIDLDDPFVGLARRILTLTICGPATKRAENLVRLARAADVDGAINPCNWGCRQGAGARGIFEEHLKSAGFPVLNLEVDCVDERNFAEGQLRTRLEAFVELLTMRAEMKRNG